MKLADAMAQARAAAEALVAQAQSHGDTVASLQAEIAQATEQAQTLTATMQSALPPPPPQSAP